MEYNGQFPRELTAVEKELLLWVLPEDRSGYREYRELVQSWNVMAQGRRGEGNYILAADGEQVDNESPLPQILAQGVVLTTEGQITVTVRERLGNQIEYEIDGIRRATSHGAFKEIKRWTLSTWSPGMPCPNCGTMLREVKMKTEHGRTLTLALCAKDHRLWVHDDITQINHPIPVTNIYNELVMHKNVRDPKVAFDSQRLFTDLHAFSDAELAKAFVTYNDIRTKVQLNDRIHLDKPRKRSLWNRLFSKA
jgi:hypothetical protein